MSVLTPGQAQIVSVVRKGRNLLITGQAGSGKSTVVKEIMSLKHICKTIINGINTDYHSVFHIPKFPLLRNPKGIPCLDFLEGITSVWSTDLNLFKVDSILEYMKNYIFRCKRLLSTVNRNSKIESLPTWIRDPSRSASVILLP